KYSPENGQVNIAVYTKGNRLISRIQDNGYGIPKEDQGKVFGKFFRGSNATKIEPSGTGLGLYLAKAIVESSSGSIRFESEPERGTTFWVELPYIVSMKPKNDTV
ncbi:MAG TPA: ATP-binding protein, partial [candidate division WWE3 bacterium]|nr:ATP-binding protein [candidate division WWE3 bacterium]